MKKRFNLTWRLVVVAALLCALVPAALIGVTAQAASTPTTYIDQLPAYLNNAGLGTVVSGTSYTGAIDLQKVRLRIKTYDSAWTPAIWRYWDGAGWTNDEETYIYATLIAASLWNGQWDWEWTDLNLITGTISDGSKIYISAWAVDNNDNIGTEVSTSFTYDQYGLLSGTTYPSVVVNPAFNSPSWTTPTTIQGTATDRISATAYGTIAAVFLNITRSNGDHWNGAAWAGADTALKATLGTPTSTSTPWSISTSTVPAIPVWTQAETYTVCVWAVDLAGNEGIPVCETFTYCKDLASGLSLVVDTVPAYIQPTFFGNLTGTARAKALKTLDAPNGSVKVWLQDYTSALSWNGSDWIPVYDTWFAAFTNISCRINNSEQRDWMVAMPNGSDLQAGHTYKYQVKAVDNGSATPVLSTVYQFIVDNAAPANTVFSTFWTTASPYGDTVFNSLTSLSGTSADTTGGTAAGSLAKVDICIQRASDSRYWNGGQWQLAQVWLPASGTNPWTFATLPAFQHINVRIGGNSGIYTITARAVDKAGWVEGTATRTFTFVKDLSGTAPSETTAPVSPAIYRTPSTMDFWVAINGSAPANKSLSISNSGGGTLDWTVSSDQTWLTVSPSTGTNAGTVNVTATLGALTVATHTGNLTITAAGATNSPQTVAVTFVVAAEGSTEPTPTPTATVAPTATATVAPTATATVAPTATATVAPTTAPSSTGSGTVGTGAGTVETTDGKIEVSFPAGSFTSDQTVTITGGTCTHANTDDYKVGSTCFSVTPGGTFDNPVTICVELSTYDKSIVDDEGKLTLAYWDGSEWVEADDINITGNTICGTTKHLSDWAVIGKTGEGWVWWYWVLIGGGAFIVVLAIVLLLVLPKKGGKEEEVPAEELYGEEEEEF